MILEGSLSLNKIRLFGYIGWFINVEGNCLIIFHQIQQLNTL